MGVALRICQDAKFIDILHGRLLDNKNPAG